MLLYSHRMNEWMSITHLLHKNIYISFLLLERVETGWIRVGERHWPGDGESGYRQVEHCYIDLFLTHVVIPYWWPYVFASLVISSQSGSAVSHCTSGWPSERLLPWLGCCSNWLTVTLWLTANACAYLCIYNFVTPTNPVGVYVICFCLSTHVSYLSVHIIGKSCPRNPWLTALSRNNMEHYSFSLELLRNNSTKIVLMNVQWMRFPKLLAWNSSIHAVKSINLDVSSSNINSLCFWLSRLLSSPITTQKIFL